MIGDTIWHKRMGVYTNHASPAYTFHVIWLAYQHGYCSNPSCWPFVDDMCTQLLRFFLSFFSYHIPNSCAHFKLKKNCSASSLFSATRLSEADLNYLTRNDAHQTALDSLPSLYGTCTAYHRSKTTPSLKALELERGTSIVIEESGRVAGICSLFVNVDSSSSSNLMLHYHRWWISMNSGKDGLTEIIMRHSRFC